MKAMTLHKIDALIQYRDGTKETVSVVAPLKGFRRTARRLAQDKPIRRISRTYNHKVLKQ